jgi:hypothetical protein
MPEGEAASSLRSDRLSEAASSSLIVKGLNVIVTEVVERAVAERPGHGKDEACAAAKPRSLTPGLPPTPIRKRRLFDIQRRLLRVACRRCGRTVEIQKVDAVRLYGPESLWKEVGQRLLDAGGRTRA